MDVKRSPHPTSVVHLHHPASQPLEDKHNVTLTPKKKVEVIVKLRHNQGANYLSPKQQDANWFKLNKSKLTIHSQCLVCTEEKPFGPPDGVKTQWSGIDFRLNIHPK